MPKPKSLNRKHNTKYKRVEAYLNDDTKNKLLILRKIIGFSISEYIEHLINKEYDNLIKAEGGEQWKNSTEKMHKNTLKEE